MIARRNGNLRLHQIHTKDLFGNRVLHLQARVGFDENIGQRRAVQIHQKFKRTQACVPNFGGHAQRILRNAFAQRLRQAGAGRNFHQLLKAPLQRAFTLAQRQRPFAAVAQNLHLDMARASHQSLDIDTIDAKRSLRLAAAAFIGSSHLIRTGHGAHAATAAAANGFDHDAASTIGLLLHKKVLRLRQRHRLLAAGHQRHTALLGQRTGFGLVAQQRQLCGSGANKAHIRCCTGPRKVCVLTQKAIAGVQCFTAMGLGNLQQMRAIQVGCGAAGVQCHCLIGGFDMRGIRIVLRIHGQTGNAQFVQRTNDAQGNLTTIGNQDFFKHRTFVLIAACAIFSRA